MALFSDVILILGFLCIVESARVSRDQSSTEWRRQNEQPSIPKNTRHIRRKYTQFPRSKPFYNYDLNNENAIKYFESNKIASSNRTNKEQTRRNNKVQARTPERRSADGFELQGKVSQFHSQDSKGRVSFGFNSPYQARFEERDNDGTVRGSYSYLDTNGKKIEVNYWDNGDGFHVQGNNFPTLSDLPQIPQFTPEVQAARDMHFRIYDEILASTNRFHNDLKMNAIPAIPIVNLAPQVAIPVHDDLRYNFGNIIVPTYIPFDDGSDKNVDHDLHFLDSKTFGEQLKNKVKQDVPEKNIPQKTVTNDDNVSSEIKNDNSENYFTYDDKNSNELKNNPEKSSTDDDKDLNSLKNIPEKSFMSNDRIFNEFKNIPEKSFTNNDKILNEFAQNNPENVFANNDKIVNEFIQYSWRTKPEDKLVSTTENLPKTLKDIAIVVPNLKDESIASASNKIAQITSNENAKAFEKYSEKFTSKTQDVVETGKGVDKNADIIKSRIQDFNSQNFQALKIKPEISPEKLDAKKDLQGHNVNVTSSSNKVHTEDMNKSVNINVSNSENILKTTQKPKPFTTTITTTTTDSPKIPLKTFDKIYDLSNAFSDISNTNIFDPSNSLQNKLNNATDITSSESYDQINNKTISKIYDLTKDSAENIDNKNQLSSIFDGNNLGFDVPSDNNETRLVNARTNNSFYYHFYHPTSETLEKQGRSNVLSELVGVTSKRLHVSSNKKPQVRPYYYFPVVYP